LYGVGKESKTMKPLSKDAIPRIYYSTPTFDELIRCIKSSIKDKSKFTVALLADNGFNPLIAQRYKEIKLKLKDIFQLVNKVKAIMAKDSNKWNHKDLLNFEKNIEKQAGDFGEYIIPLHKNWYDRIRGIRESIQRKNLIELVSEIESIYDNFQKCDPSIPLKDFLEFSGIFSLCKWYWIKPEEKSPPGALTDVITAWHWGMNRPDQWVEFKPYFTPIELRTEFTPKKMLYNAFGANLVRYNTKDDSMLNWDNPLGQILRGKIEDDTFLNANDFLIYDYEYLHLAPSGEGEKRQTNGPLKSSLKVEWSKDAFSKTVIGKVACNVNYKNDKSYRDFIDKESENSCVIKKTKATKKWLVNMVWIREKRNDLNDEKILLLLNDK
jgi:hypothetical protein